MSVQRMCSTIQNINISLTSFKFLNSCILFNIEVIDLKLNINNLNVLFLT